MNKMFNPDLSGFGARILILASNTTIKSIKTVPQLVKEAEIIIAIFQICDLCYSS